MPTLKRADAEIYYEEYGSGYPILLFAPGGMRSQIAMWRAAPGGPPRAWNDWTEVLPRAGYRVIAMDQRNAGKSKGAIAANHGWQTYAADQIALLDHLGIARCHTLGGCIGSSFCLMLSQTAPSRVSAQVLQNPIGLNPEFPTYFQEAFADWAKELKASRPEVDDAALAAFGRNMWDHDFVYCMQRDAVPKIQTPSLVMPGDDKPHPAYAGLALAELLPHAEMQHQWKAPAYLDAARERTLDFLAKHTPKGAAAAA
jgi:pimeloyl-ACP methyl ester carboxylesterase